MIPLPKEPKIAKYPDNKAVFEIEALYPGYGVTLGNALRRVLYSSLPGAAITQVSIKGVQHEFSTITHILEDVLTICLNLKQVRFKTHSSEPQIGTLKVSGEREVKAGDFVFPAKQVEVVNPHQHIATITHKKGSLEMEVQNEQGLGYLPSEGRMAGKGAVGRIVLDAIFAAVRRVKYDVEHMRVGERTDFDRLILEIETDGSITPEDAFWRACDILIGQFEFLKNAFLPKGAEVKKVQPKDGKPKKALKKSATEKEKSKTKAKVKKDTKKKGKKQ